MNERRLTWRVMAIWAGMVAAWGALAVRLVFLHLAPEAEIVSRSSKTNVVVRTLLAGRGAVCDAGGRSNVLAINLPTQDLGVDPWVAVCSGAVEKVACVLSAVAGLPADQVVQEASSFNKRYVPLLPDVPAEQANAIAKIQLPGVYLTERTIRFYPHGAFMCHVLGFVNRAGEGSCGVELWADEYLRGSPGASVGQVDARRRPTRQGKMQIIPPLPGADVHLTLNQHVQFIVENALDEAVAANQAKGAWAIVQEVRSGRILAMASRPGFNLNGFSEVDPSLWLNRAIGYVYEPGSVFKAATISAALEEKTVTPDTVFDCENGAWLYNRRVLRDFHPYGHLTVADGVKKSSNILAAKVSLTLGEERLYRRLRAFGIGQKTGIDLPGEEKGLLRPPSAWSDLCATRIAIGQSVAVTALQMLNVYCTIANEGRMMKPYLVDRIVAADGSVQRQCRPEVVRQVISRRTAATVCRLLARVTEEGGTGHAARIDGYTVAGKTGTAQKAQRGGYSDSDYVASFVGFFPAESPVIGIIVVVDEPQPKHTGGVVAAPVFSVIASQVARCVDVAAPEPLLARTGR